MEINARKITDAAKQKTGCAVVAIFARKKLSEAARQLDKASDGLISNALKNGEVSGNTGESLMLHLGGKQPAYYWWVVAIPQDWMPKVGAKLSGLFCAA